jgi:hypothetical protein
VYEVQFPDGRTKEVAANVIAQVLYSQCDPNGNEFVLLDSTLHPKNSLEHSLEGV